MWRIRLHSCCFDFKRPSVSQETEEVDEGIALASELAHEESAVAGVTQEPLEESLSRSFSCVKRRTSSLRSASSGCESGAEAGADGGVEEEEEARLASGVGSPC